MGKVYWEAEITKIMNDEISSRMDRLLRGDADIPADVKAIERLRHYREFADEITALLIRADMDEEEAEKQKRIEFQETEKAAAEAYDNLFDKKTWLKKAEENHGTDS